jgi:hypothetical protein
MAATPMLVAYRQMLADDELFTRALARMARGAGGEESSVEDVSLNGLLLLLDLVLDMLAESGLLNLLGVYKAVKKHTSVHFERSMLWQTCHLSGICARGCLKLGEDVFVHSQHAKWVLCLWLSTHMRELERSRDAVPAAQAAVYRAALSCVLDQLEGVYTHVSQHLKKNNMLACVEPAAVCK